MCNIYIYIYIYIYRNKMNNVYNHDICIGNICKSNKYNHENNVLAHAIYVLGHMM